jgi:hypothetical protein
MDSEFLTRLEMELRGRRARDLDRCLRCGLKIQHGADYESVDSGFIHSGCTEWRPIISEAAQVGRKSRSRRVLAITTERNPSGWTPAFE